LRKGDLAKRENLLHYSRARVYASHMKPTDPPAVKLLSGMPSVLVAIVLGTVAGCAGNAPAFQRTVQQRAAFDLSCPTAQLTVQNIGGDSYGATGCGRKASYTCICAWSEMGECEKPVCAMDGASPSKAPSAP
jgi:hypothetical protein